MKNLMKISLTLAVLFGAAVAWAQGSDHLQITTVVQKEQLTVTESGEQKTELVVANTVVPGDSVVYTISFKNIGDEAADNVVITNPVPQDLTYEMGSAFGSGAAIEFSVDGGSVFAPAAELTINDDGEPRAARAEDYTHIRWVMSNDLAAGAQGFVQFRARLN